MSGGFLWPREHGAWAMLLFPFLAALVVAGEPSWESLAALVALLGVFMVQEPLLVLLRQRFVWRERRAITSQAVSTLLRAGLPAAAASALVLWRLPWKPLVVLGAGAAVLLALRMALTLANKQRSAVLQVVEATGLSATALLGYLSARGALHEAAYVLWAVFSLHHAAALFVIRARLEAIAGARSVSALLRRYRVAAWVAQAVLLAAVLGTAAAGGYVLAAAFAVPLVLHSVDLLRLGDPAFLKTPLVRVGWREVAISTAFAVLTVSALRM